MAELDSPTALIAAAAAILPLPRSLTGKGVRETLDRLGEHVPLRQVEVPTGTPALDWEVPEEWTLRAARLTAPDGSTVVDAADHPLHVVGYSQAIDRDLELSDLLPHLHSDASQPDVIPYRTSYYSPYWGFCLPDRVRANLSPGTYHALIDAETSDGAMTYGELILPGDTDEEILVTSHVCHPGMANDNVSGNVVAAALAQVIADRPDRRHTWRFLWLPGTIGELTWLATHPEVIPRIRAGVVLAGIGDGGDLTYKRSRRGDTVTDRVARLVLQEMGVKHELVDYSPWGYAERQFCSPGFDLAVGRLSRTEHGTYPEYHTSADDLTFISGQALMEALQVLEGMASVLDGNAIYRNLRPHGEPRLGPRGLYPTMGGPAAAEAQLALLWVLSESDGGTDLLAVAERSGIRFSAIKDAALALARTDLLLLHAHGGV